eukprot:2980118-Pyramimonas_sp.AAC.1
MDLYLEALPREACMTCGGVFVGLELCFHDPKIDLPGPGEVLRADFEPDQVLGDRGCSGGAVSAGSVGRLRERGPRGRP